MDETRSSEYYRLNEGPAQNDVIDQLNIRYRVCHLFTENTKINQKDVPDSEKLCKCGLVKSKHRPELEGLVSEWHMQDNTLAKINSAYGPILNEALYIRLALDTPLEKVEKLLLDAWEIPKPRFIVSIIGGAKYFKLSERLETNFINGIVDIAKKSDTWLLTSGYNVGIVQLVGEAIYKVKLTDPEHQITAIGIPKWGSIVNVESVINSNQEESEQKTTNINNTIKKRRKKGEWELDPHHTHYLMLDDGTIRHYDTKDYRTLLAIHMAKLKRENDFVVPLVTIMVEGGKDTIANVFYDLHESIPVVIVNGSGRAANLLYRWLMLTKDLDHKIDNPKIVRGIDEFDISNGETKDKKKKHDSSSSSANSTKHHIDSKRTKLETMFDGYINQLDEDLKETLSLEEIDRTLRRQVMYCLQPAVRSDITVFNLNSDNDLSETILRSICESRQRLTRREENKRNEAIEREQRRLKKHYNPERKNIESHYNSLGNRKDQNSERSRLLDLAMDWNRIDVAKEFIFKNSLDNILNEIQAFKNALTKNLPTFVDEFLRLKINLHEVFFPQSDPGLKDCRYKIFLKTLYKKDVVNQKHVKTHLKSFMHHKDANSEKIVTSVEDLNLILHTLIGDYMHKLYFDTSKEETEYRIESGLTPKKETLSDDKKPLTDDEKNLMKHNYIMRDLFIWSILMNFTDMAKVLLSHMEYRICPALIATKILKKYHQKAEYGDLKKSYLKNAKYFEQYAIDCLDKCDDRDVDKACEIILQRNEVYGYVTCLQVAADAEDKLFIASPCCVQAIANVWHDKLDPAQKSSSDILSLIVGYVSLGLLAPIFVSYRRTERDIKKIDPSDKKLRSNGINYSDPSILEYYVRPPAKPEYKRYFPKLIKFHQSSPMKFCYHLITYFFFLLLFSYVLLFNFEPPTNQIPSIHWTEILTIMLVSCMLIEEIHYFFRQDNLSWGGRFQNYFDQLFKSMTVLAVILFYIGLIVRFRHADSQEDFTAARIIMAIDLEIWWLRSLSFVTIFKILGPHIVAIGEMLKDLIFFISVIATVMIGYGVASRSMVYYPKANGFTTATGGSIDTNFDGRNVFRQIFSPVYYFLYGDFSNELANLDSNPNAGWSIATQVILAFHMMFVNILLVNLLIAMFSKRFDQVHDHTHKIWHSQEYLRTREYYTRSPFFPPITLICDIYYLCRMLFYFIRRSCHYSGDYGAKVFQIIPKNDYTIEEWRKFEEESTYEYAHNEVKAWNAASAKSASESESSNKKKKEQMSDDENDGNKTVDDLKKVETNLIKLTDIIVQMKESCRIKKKTT